MKRKVVMFQGDSITDAHRDRRNNHNLSGFSQYVKDILGDSFEYVNYGISGDTSRHCVNRHEGEATLVKPDILVILIGINDIWRNVSNNIEDATTSEEFIRNTIKILDDSKRINPKIKIIYLEPFLLPGSTMVYEKGFDLYKTNVSLIKKYVPPLVDKYIFLQDYFVKNTNENTTFVLDGVHLNDYGNHVVAKYVAKAIKELLN